MISVTVQQRGLQLQLVSQGIDEAAKRLIQRLADYAEAEMRNRAPVRTGVLRASIQKTVGEKEAQIGPTVPYAMFVEYGTRPHEIRPVNARALRFEMGGGTVFATLVRHPGTRPQPFIRETAEAVKSQVEPVFREIWGEQTE